MKAIEYICWIFFSLVGRGGVLRFDELLKSGASFAGAFQHGRHLVQLHSLRRHRLLGVSQASLVFSFFRVHGFGTGLCGVSREGVDGDTMMEVDGGSCSVAMVVAMEGVMTVVTSVVLAAVEVVAGGQAWMSERSCLPSFVQPLTLPSR